MRVVFMGTPDFAVATLEAIFRSSHEIVGVVTTPDKPAGRGLKIQPSKVKEFALENGLPILQPEKLKDSEFIEAIKCLNADVFVVVAFRMLPYEVYSIPKQGAFNVHASLLPQYRGAAPIHWAIMNGETKTGVSTFFLNNEIDCGDIILQKECEILPNENTGELYDRLKVLGAEAALETLKLLETKILVPIQQNLIDVTSLKIAPKIHKDDTIIDWNLPAKDIVNQIRALAPHPGAVTFLTNKDQKNIPLKIFNASIIREKQGKKAGNIETDNKSFVHISSKDFQISVHNLQMGGKKRLNTDVFLQGNNLDNYIIL